MTRKRVFKRDPNGIAAILRSTAMRDVVHAAAERVKDGVETSKPAPLAVDDYTTDRAASSVTIKHPAGRAWQAKHGTLTRAATAAGLDVTAR